MTRTQRNGAPSAQWLASSPMPTLYPSLDAVAQRRAAGAPLFGLGQLVATPGANALLIRAACSPARWLARHQRGDWGELDASDLRANDEALVHGARILSAYTVAGTRIYIITEAVNEDTDRRDSTCILLPEEY